MTYEVIENDIALLNVYFGESTATGKYDGKGNSVFIQI